MSNFDLSHLNFLTDDFGIWQFCSKSGILKKYGYTLDDNTRALIVALLLEKKGLAKIYFNYLKLSYKSKSGFFYGEIDPQKRRKAYPSSEDSFGEALWALGLALHFKFHKKEVLKISSGLLKSISKLRYARGLAYSILGLIYLDLYSAVRLGQRLLAQFPSNNNWFWPEGKVTYGNAILPYALFRLHIIFHERAFFKAGLKSLRFLDKVSRLNKIPAPIGNKGWHPKGGERAKFDQQPIDAAYMTMAYVAAFEAAGRQKYYQQAKEWFDWFHGKNILKLSLWDKQTGRVSDGIVKNELSLNSGAESIVCYLLAQWMLKKRKTV